MWPHANLSDSLEQFLLCQQALFQAHIKETAVELDYLV